MPTFEENMAKHTARWDITVPKDLDIAIRKLLAADGVDRNSDLSPYVEEAMRNFIFDHSVAQLKSNNAHLSEKEIEDLVDESVRWARAQ